MISGRETVLRRLFDRLCFLSGIGPGNSAAGD
jgi:hypothetical protein